MNPLATHYSRFRVAERLLLTGHSHQAWPDVALAGQVEAFDDAALCVDEKWGRAFAKAERVREGFRALLGDPGGELALGGSTHDLVLRFLSALDLRSRPRLVTTDGEFHTLRRQLGRLGEDWLDVVRVDARPADTLAERLAAAADERTSAILVSAVLFADRSGSGATREPPGGRGRRSRRPGRGGPSRRRRGARSGPTCRRLVRRAARAVGGEQPAGTPRSEDATGCEERGR